MSDRHPRNMKHSNGFTLIEMMVVVLILACLSTVAISHYSKYIGKAKRTEGVIALTDLGRLQETFYSIHEQYARNVREAGFAMDYGQFISDSVYEGKYYRYATSWRDQDGRTFMATAVGNLDGDGFNDILLIYR